MADKFPKTKVRIVRYLADKTDLTQAQVASVLEQLAKLAYAGAKEKGGFPVPGLGKVSMIQRKARMGFNPARRGVPLFFADATGPRARRDPRRGASR